MNPTLRFIQKQGLKISLPLLLLAATACTTSPSSTGLQAKSSDSAPALQDAPPIIAVPDAPSASGAALQAAAGGTPSDGADKKPNVLPPTGDTSDAGAGAGAGPGAGAGAGVAASVPEPAALAGLAIAAAGMIVLKRKQAA